RDPYFLYGASNLGSLLGLLAYPLVIEPRIGLDQQATLWATGYLVLALLTLACAVAVLRPAAAAPAPVPAGECRSVALRPGHGSRLRWVALGFIPSCLLLGVTTALTTDLAPIPLLWVLPLSLYLLSFVLVFARRPFVSDALMARALPPAVM